MESNSDELIGPMEPEIAYQLACCLFDLPLVLTVWTIWDLEKDPKLFSIPYGSLQHLSYKLTFFEVVEEKQDRPHLQEGRWS